MDRLHQRRSAPEAAVKLAAVTLVGVILAAVFIGEPALTEYDTRVDRLCQVTTCDEVTP
jgi:hypothetical protein